MEIIPPNQGGFSHVISLLGNVIGQTRPYKLVPLHPCTPAISTENL